MRCAPALALLAAVAATASAADMALPPITRVTLENGMRVVVAETRELPLVEFQVVVMAGAAQDPAGKAGLAALTAASLGRGAGGLAAEEFARAVESLGGELGAAAGIDGTVANGEFLSEDLDAGLELLRKMLREPAFAKDEIRRVRDEQLAAIQSRLDDPGAVADRCYGALLFGGHAYGRPAEGGPATVPGLGRGDVRDFYERWYRPNNTVLVLVGDVAADAAVARVRQAFGSWEARADAVPPRAPVPPRLTARRVLLVDKPDATQTQIRFGNVSIARSDPDWAAAQVANTILGGGFTSKLIEELRVKRSLTYSASSSFVARLTGGDFRVATFTKSPTTAETLLLGVAVEDAFRRSPPAPGVLAKARTYLMGQFPLRIETPDALAARLAELELYDLPRDDLATFRSRVAAVTPDDVARVATATMPAGDAVAIVVVGKAAEIRGQLEEKLGPVETVPPAACDALGAR